MIRFAACMHTARQYRYWYACSKCSSSIAHPPIGVDYTHPLLGGGFGPGFKVEGGHDFVGNDYGGYIDVNMVKLLLIFLWLIRW